MTRRLTKLAAVYLMLGLVATWAVAWACAAWVPMISGTLTDVTIRRTHDGDRTAFQTATMSRFGSRRQAWAVIDEMGGDPSSDGLVAFVMGWDSDSIEARPAPSNWPSLPLHGRALRRWTAEGGLTRGVEDARGWPAVALSCGADLTQFWNRLDAEHFEIQAGIRLEPWPHPLRHRLSGLPLTFRHLPYRPVWPGLIADTLFYGAVIFGLHQLAGFTKRRRRYRRGLCPACRYDLRADYSHGCSECGWGRA